MSNLRAVRRGTGLTAAAAAGAACACMLNACVCLLSLQMPGWVSAALDPSVTLAFLDTDGIQPAAAAEDSLAPGGGVVNLGEVARASCYLLLHDPKGSLVRASA